jgi:hypothetical protein
VPRFQRLPEHVPEAAVLFEAAHERLVIVHYFPSGIGDVGDPAAFVLESLLKQDDERASVDGDCRHTRQEDGLIPARPLGKSEPVAGATQMARAPLMGTDGSLAWSRHTLRLRGVTAV